MFFYDILTVICQVLNLILITDLRNALSNTIQVPFCYKILYCVCTKENDIQYEVIVQAWFE